MQLNLTIRQRRGTLRKGAICLFMLRVTCSASSRTAERYLSVMGGGFRRVPPPLCEQGKLNQQNKQSTPCCWLILTVDHVDDLPGSGTDTTKSFANNLVIIRLPRRQAERRTAGVEPAVAPDDVRDGLGLDFAFRPFGVIVDIDYLAGRSRLDRPAPLVWGNKQPRERNIRTPRCDALQDSTWVSEAPLCFG